MLVRCAGFGERREEDRRGGRTGHHAPAVGCALGHGGAPVSGGGAVLQRPVQLERKVRMRRDKGRIRPCLAAAITLETRT